MTKNIYKLKNKVRIVTATSLFDGHDAAINIMRRILQSSGAEVIHLGHNRSAAEIVDCAVQEDVQAIAVTSYQGGHNEFFRYLFDLLTEQGAGDIKVFGGGGGTILPEEAEALQRYGIARIYTPDNGREMGLQGMINDLLRQCDFPVKTELTGGLKALSVSNPGNVARAITLAENHPEKLKKLLDPVRSLLEQRVVPVAGITGTGGAGKSSLTDELLRRYLQDFPDKTLAILSVDPTKRKTGGALLADRIRMNAIHHPRVFMRSLATRQSHRALSGHIREATAVCKLAGFDLIIIETSGIGQSDTEIIEHSDLSLYVMTPEYGAATQLEKIDMLDYADLVAVNKFDKKGGPDALKDVKKQFKRNAGLWDAKEETLPVFGTTASRFNDSGMHRLYQEFLQALTRKTGVSFLSESGQHFDKQAKDAPVIPPDRVRYLAEIVENNRDYDRWAADQSALAQQLYQLKGTIDLAGGQDSPGEGESLITELKRWYSGLEKGLHADCKALIESWPQVKRTYREQEFVYRVRDKEHCQPLFSESLAGLRLPRIALPAYQAWGDLLRWLLQENVPGKFPYTSGVFPLKRIEEDPTRMFAGEGSPERTNKRFHYLSQGQSAQRLSTAFDSVTLYGEDPDMRPDIYGKIGNSGVSVATLDDCKKLYAGFDLCKPSTSVSMTINGPAPMLLGFFLNTAIDQQCEKYILENGLQEEIRKKISTLYPDKEASPPADNPGLGRELLGVTGDQVLPKEVYEKIKTFTLSTVRGTVQADILKEDQAQNTCIFSTEFALRMMGDVQDYFIRQKVKNFYSVSISGYHIAEAGANPVTQLALTLANGFTYVEYYLSRGMHIDNFAPNLSFFFSNGLDPEYSVIGRVARRIWAKAIRYKYQGNERSQKLKYHIQTSGRSLHAQEIDFNDIRTTLQALYAIYDNCNSLHTNAYDEAITTPTEASVRRAMAIQLIINRELGIAKNENPLQGSFVIEELTDLVEEAVYAEFKRITERGGVLGAMETMYQRSKIQEESLYYESRKHNGSYPIIGVNTFLSEKGSPTLVPREVIRATEEEKQLQVRALRAFQKRNRDTAPAALLELERAALENRNIFEQLMEACKVCSLGQLSHALYEAGGCYRRNM